MDEMTPEEIRAACAPKSDQFNAEDLLGGGSATLTVKRVRKGSAEQPVEIAVEEVRRVYRPAKTMRRLLMTCWGEDAWSDLADAAETFAGHVRRCHRREWDAEMDRPGFDRSDLYRMLYEIGFGRDDDGRWRAR